MMVMKLNTMASVSQYFQHPITGKQHIIHYRGLSMDAHCVSVHVQFVRVYVCVNVCAR